MPKFDLDRYVPVHERILKFWDKHPKGRIETEILELDDKRVLMIARAFREDDLNPAANGFAEEVRGQGPVNTTSALENAETSAVGRALAMMGFEVTRGVASREEMEKAQRGKPMVPKKPESQKQVVTISAKQVEELRSEFRRRAMTTGEVFSVLKAAGVKVDERTPLPDVFARLLPSELRQIKLVLHNTPEGR